MVSLTYIITGIIVTYTVVVLEVKPLGSRAKRLTETKTIC